MNVEVSPQHCDVGRIILFPSGGNRGKGVRRLAERAVPRRAAAAQGQPLHTDPLDLRRGTPGFRVVLVGSEPEVRLPQGGRHHILCTRGGHWALSTSELRTGVPEPPAYLTLGSTGGSMGGPGSVGLHDLCSFPTRTQVHRGSETHGGRAALGGSGHPAGRENSTGPHALRVSWINADPQA